MKRIELAILGRSKMEILGSKRRCNLEVGK